MGAPRGIARGRFAREEHPLIDGLSEYRSLLRRAGSRATESTFNPLVPVQRRHDIANRVRHFFISRCFAKFRQHKFYRRPLARFFHPFGDATNGYDFDVFMAKRLIPEMDRPVSRCVPMTVTRVRQRRDKSG